MLVRVDGHEPSSFDEDLRKAQGRLLVPDGIGSVGIDFPRGDRVLRPVIDEPVQELLDRKSPRSCLISLSMRELLACPDSKGVLGTLGILNVFVCPPLRSLFRNVRPSTRLLS